MMKISVTRKNILISPDRNRVFARFFFYGEERAENLIKKVLKMPESKVESLLLQILREFSTRHRSITTIFNDHFQRVKYIVDKQTDKVSEWRQLLIGSYFTMEYALESAALFNPSIVEDLDQSGLHKGEKRVIVCLRATGEGHISSIVFRRAIIDEKNNILLQEPGKQIGEAEVIKSHIYERKDFAEKLKEMDIDAPFSDRVLKQLPERFTYDQIRDIIKKNKTRSEFSSLENQIALDEILWLADSHSEIRFSLDKDLSERIIFPISKFERNGIEDARFTRFLTDKGKYVYYGTYTAYDGYTILPKLIETTDFYSFKIFPIHGKSAIDKNLALFPRKINGKYAMISRIDGVNNYIMFSDKLHRWGTAKVLSEPLYDWELVQVGNGGSPIETDLGWLMVTHGVGPVRKYCLGACLLDLKDPTKVIARLKEPLLIPDEAERAGYVPNVVYTCGVIVHNDSLIIPYAISDYASSFAVVNLNMLLYTILNN